MNQHLDLGLESVHIDGKVILFVNYLLFAWFHVHRFKIIKFFKNILFVHFCNCSVYWSVDKSMGIVHSYC